MSYCCHMPEYAIKVVPLGVYREDVEWLVQSLRSILNATVVVEPKLLGMSVLLDFYDEERGQINAEDLLEKLQSMVGVVPHQRILVLVNGDGFVEGLNFVFGISKPGWGGIIFTERLKPEFYGDPPSVPLFRARLLKESLHELGHSFGLSHCPRRCVMRFSNSIYDVDDKPASFCSLCVVALNRSAPGLLRVV